MHVSCLIVGSASCLIWSQPTGISYQLMYWRVESFHVSLSIIFLCTLFLKFGELGSFPTTDRGPALEIEHSFQTKKEGHNDSRPATFILTFKSHFEGKVDINRRRVGRDLRSPIHHLAAQYHHPRSDSHC